MILWRFHVTRAHFLLLLISSSTDIFVTNNEIILIHYYQLKCIIYSDYIRVPPPITLFYPSSNTMLHTERMPLVPTLSCDGFSDIWDDLNSFEEYMLFFKST